MLIEIITLLALNTAHAEVVRGDVSLLKEPRFDSPVVKNLPAKSQVSVVQRKGLWVFVKGAGTDAGWLKSYQVMQPLTPAAQAGAKNNFQLNSSRVTGVKGLTEEDLKKMPVNPEAATVLETYRSTKELAQEFADTTGLVKSQVAYPVKEKK